MISSKDPDYEGHERAYRNGLENSRILSDYTARRDVARLSELVNNVLFTEDAYWEGRITGLLERKEEL